MALTNIISGELRNKVGGYVGAKWKGKAYVRAYVIPKDANTAAQQAIRGQFAKVTYFSSAINNDVLKPFIAKQPKNMSPANMFMKLNKEFIADNTKGYESIKIFHGHLPTATAFSATAVEADQSVTVTLTPVQHGSVLATDQLIVVAFCETTDSFNYGSVERGDQANPLTLNIPLDYTSGDTIHLYLTAAQKKVANGNTTYLEVTATS